MCNINSSNELKIIKQKLPHIPVRMISPTHVKVGDGSVKLKMSDSAMSELNTLSEQYNGQIATKAVIKNYEDAVNQLMQKLHRQGEIEILESSDDELEF